MLKREAPDTRPALLATLDTQPAMSLRTRAASALHSTAAVHSKVYLFSVLGRLLLLTVDYCRASLVHARRASRQVAMRSSTRLREYTHQHHHYVIRELVPDKLRTHGRSADWSSADVSCPPLTRRPLASAARKGLQPVASLHVAAIIAAALIGAERQDLAPSRARLSQRRLLVERAAHEA